MSGAGKVVKDAVVRIEYTLKDDGGKVIDKSEGEPLAYIHGHGNLVPGMENALDGKSAGESFSIKVPPAEGYGELDPEAIFKIPRSKMPKNIELKKGMELASRGPQGQVMRFVVKDILGDEVVADANHPLAGQNLNFDVKVVDVRPATAEELTHGHVHGEGGHHHH